MDRRQPLLLIHEALQVSSGLHPDRFALSKPLWDEAENARFFAGKVKRLLPAELLLSTGAGYFARGLSQQQDSAGNRYVWSARSDGKVYRDAGLIHTFASMRPDDTALTPASYIDFTHWGNWTLMNSGLGAIQRYDGSVVAALPGAPTDVVALLKRANQLFALGTDNTNKEVAWSHADNIENWTAEASTLAGALTLEDLDTGIRAGSKLSGNIAVYAEDQMGLLFFVGAPFYFGGKVELDGIGAVGKMAVCSEGPLNYGMGRNGCWQTDGRSYRYIDNGVLSGYLQETVNWDQAGKCLVFRNDVNRCIEFHFPAGDEVEVSEAWSYDPQTQGWGQAVPMQLAAERRLFSRPLGAKDGSVYLLEADAEAAGALNLKTKPLLLQQTNGHPLRGAALVDEVELMMKEASSVEFRYGVAERLDGPWDFSEWKPIASNMAAHQHGLSISGVYHKLEFRSTQANWSFDLQGFALYGLADGRRGDKD